MLKLNGSVHAFCLRVAASSTDSYNCNSSCTLETKDCGVPWLVLGCTSLGIIWLTGLYVFWYIWLSVGCTALGIIWLIVDCMSFGIVWLILDCTCFGITGSLSIVRLLVLIG